MAEGTTVSSRETVCPFFLYSSCKDGSRCKYVHDAPTTRNESDSSICRFFRKGTCKYGDDCWYSHSTVRNNVNPKSPLAGPSRQRLETVLQSTPKRDVNKADAYLPKCSFSNRSVLKRAACSPNSPNWVNAPEFVPRCAPRSYADTVKANVFVKSKPKKLDMELCVHFYEGKCPLEDECPCIHGKLCELCNKYCLNPYDERQQKLHIEYCEKEMVKDMELSFAIQRSQDKTCGICMDVVLEKDSLTERRFGILEKCNHVFCLPCIRKWRKVKTFESAQVDHLIDPSVTRACPECRIASDFITPSNYWVESEEEKTKLIAAYKVALSKKPCKYFKQGKGMCPFGGACFYLHAKPDGSKVELPLPTRRQRQNQDGDLDIMGRIFLWDFLEGRENELEQIEIQSLLIDGNFDIVDRSNSIELDPSVLRQLGLEEFIYAISDDTDHESDSSEEDFFLSESF